MVCNAFRYTYEQACASVWEYVYTGCTWGTHTHEHGMHTHMSGRRSRNKGAGWEREAAHMLRPIYGDGVHRGYQARDGAEAADVEGTPFWVECKRGKKVNLRAALRQATAATDGRPCLVLGRDDREEPWAFMRAQDLIDVLHRLEKLEKGLQAGDLFTKS